MKIKNIKQTCEAAPCQWEIELEDGRMIYVRYRGGFLSIRKSENPTTAILDAIRGEEIFGKQLGDEYDGVIEEKEMLKYLKEFLD